MGLSGHPSRRPTAGGSQLERQCRTGQRSGSNGRRIFLCLRFGSSLTAGGEFVQQGYETETFSWLNPAVGQVNVVGITGEVGVMGQP